MHEAFGDRMAPPEALEALIADGRLGRKNEEGLLHVRRTKKKEVDETRLRRSCPRGKNRKKLEPRRDRGALPFSRWSTRRSAAWARASSAARATATSARSSGSGFPPFLGGPFRYADAIGARALLERMERWHDKLGHRFEPAPLLVDHARAGTRFHP